MNVFLNLRNWCYSKRTQIIHSSNQSGLPDLCDGELDFETSISNDRKNSTKSLTHKSDIIEERTKKSEHCYKISARYVV